MLDFEFNCILLLLSNLLLLDKLVVEATLPIIDGLERDVDE